MSDISSIKLPDNSSYNVKAKKIFYAECSTAKSDVAKVVTCSGFVLEAGAMIAIRFTDTTTTTPKSGNITLNINNTGAKNIVPKGNNSVFSYGWSWAFCNNQTWLFMYNGTYFVCMNQDNNTTYSNMTAATASAAGKAGLVPAPAAGKNTAFLRGDGTWVIPTDSKVTSVGNHYTPAKSTTKSASGGTVTDITNSTSGTQVITGVEMDAKGHVTGVTSVALKSTDTKVTVDSALSGTSTNPVQNKVINSALAGKAAANHTHTVSQISDFPASLPANGGNADTVGLRYSNDFLGKDYVYPTFVNYGFGADLNNYVTEYHGFVYNCVNSPIAYNYGFLDVSFFDGSGFSPSPADKGGVVLQKFSRTDNCVFTRMRVANVWSNWSRLDSESHATGIISGLVNGTSITIPLSFSPVAVLFFNSANHHANGGFSLSLGTNQFVFTPASVSAIGSTSVRWLAFKG